MEEYGAFLEEETTKVLVEIGIPANLQGFRFLRECIIDVCKNPGDIKNVTKVLYPNVAAKFGLKSSVLERSMRHATDLGFFKTGFKPLSKRFDISPEFIKVKPSSSELIALISEHINLLSRKRRFVNAEKH